MPHFKAKLVTIITAYEHDDSVRKALEKHGVKAFSVSRSDGEGLHGPQRSGIVGSANYVFNVVTTPALAAELLSWVDRHLIARDWPAIAYTSDVEAVLKTLPGGEAAG